MRRKEARVEVRMTEHEKEALKRKAAKNGMTVSEYARTLLANSDDGDISREVGDAAMRQMRRDFDRIVGRKD